MGFGCGRVCLLAWVMGSVLVMFIMLAGVVVVDWLGSVYGCCGWFSVVWYLRAVGSRYVALLCCVTSCFRYYISFTCLPW